MEANSTPAKFRPPYLLGLLCLIPLVGAFVGAGLLLYGILKYKDKWLSIIGAAGILWTIIVYSMLYYVGSHIIPFSKGFEDLSQRQLNSLVRSVEFYNLEHGQYPDSLQQLETEDPFAPVNDPVLGMRSKGNSYFKYERMDKKYKLFSAGPDAIPNTYDDLFPQLIITDSSKFGLIMHH